MNRATRIIGDVSNRIVRPSPDLPFAEWAEHYLALPDGTPFRWHPYQRTIAEDMFRPGVSELYLRLFSGFGKTFTLGAGFSYALVEHAGSCGAMFPNESDGKSWLTNELKPTIGYDEDTDGTGVQRFHVQGIRSVRDIAGFTKFANGASIQIIGQSFSKLRRAQLDVAFADEVDALDDSSASEGDRLRAFFGRTRQRVMQRHWAASYPSVVGKSRIDECVDISQSLYWLFTCSACSALWRPHTQDLGFKRNRHGDVTHAWLTCPHCGERFDDRERRAMSTAGAWHVEGDEEHDWRPDDPATRRTYRAYSSSCMIQLGLCDENFPDYIHEVASKLAAVRRSQNPSASLRVIANQLDGESFRDESAIKPEPSELMQRREPYRPFEMLPDGVQLVTAGVDPNADFISVEIVGWGANDECWALHYEKINGNILQTDVWRALDRILTRRFRHPDGRTLPVAVTCVDTNHKPTTCRRWCAPRRSRGVIPIIGSNQLDTPLLGPRVKGKDVLRIGVNEAKETIYSRLSLVVDEGEDGFPQGYQHFPISEHYQARYFAGLVAEESELKKGRTGQFFRAYFLPPGAARPEPLDCRVYAMAAEQLRRFHYDSDDDETEEEEKPVERQPAPDLSTLARQRNRQRRTRKKRFIGA